MRNGASAEALSRELFLSSCEGERKGHLELPEAGRRELRQVVDLSGEEKVVPLPPKSIDRADCRLRVYKLQVERQLRKQKLKVILFS